MSEKQPQKSYHKASKPLPVVSTVLNDKTLVELIYRPNTGTTALAVWENNTWHEETSIDTGTGQQLVPYSASNDLIRNKVVLLPSEPMEYETEQDLINDIQTFIHRYVDLRDGFEKIATHYVLFSWVYDRFNELPYLRLRGDYGTGKTRFLLTVGSLCYKPIFASGAATVSPLFHLLEKFRGTLIIDEADFRFSDEKAAITKILNNGNVKGLPVLRTNATRNGEWKPKAFQVYGPKIIATRGMFQDRALESRFITEETSGKTLRKDIPINLPPEYEQEALELRNKLLMYRFRTWERHSADASLVDREIEPRLNQVFVPLLSVISDTNTRDELQAIARQYHKDQQAERGMDIEAQILTIIRYHAERCSGVGIAIKDITATFQKLFGAEYQQVVTPKWIGSIVRTKLQLTTHKSNGVFIVPVIHNQKLAYLYQRYGITEEDVREIEKLSP